MLFRKQTLQIVRTPDVRAERAEDFFNTLKSFHGIFMHFSIEKCSEYMLWRLQRQFGLTAHECSSVYYQACYHYGIPPSELSWHRVQRHDLCVGELRHQLWHEANQAAVQNRHIALPGRAYFIT